MSCRPTPRKSLLAFALAVFATLASVPALAGAQIRIEQFKPTQMEIGAAAVQLYVDRWTTEAGKQGLKAYALTHLTPRFAKQELPAIIDPDGTYRNTDGHHRISALLEVSRLTGVEFTVGVKVLKDYSGWKFKDYAEHFVNKLEKGQFSESVKHLSTVERMKHIPNDYKSLQNNPLRSTFETVFENMGIKGSDMRDYFDFHTAQKLLDRGLLGKLKQRGIVEQRVTTVPAHLALDPRLIQVVEHMLTKPKMEKFMRKQARNKDARRDVSHAVQRLKLSRLR